MSPNWIYNSECYSLEFSEQLVQNYFLCAYPLRREGLTNSSAKRQDYSKARESPGLKRIFLDVHMAPNSLQVLSHMDSFNFL